MSSESKPMTIDVIQRYEGPTSSVHEVDGSVTWSNEADVLDFLTQMEDVMKPGHRYRLVIEEVQ